MQVAFGQMTEQGGDFICPGSEQAMDAKELLVASFLPQFAEDRQASIAAIADDEVLLAGAAGDRRWRVQAALTDGGFDVVVERITDEPWVVLIGPQLLQRHPHGRICERVGHLLQLLALRKGTEQELVGDFLLSGLLHPYLPSSLAPSAQVVADLEFDDIGGTRTF